MMSFFKNFFTYLGSLSLTAKVVSGVVLVVVVVAGVHFASPQKAAAPVVDTVAHVTLASVASLSGGTATLPVTGTVTSLSSADILAQSSGEVVRLLHTLGDVVPAGAVIAYLENSSQQASVLQAQGAYDAAQVGLARASGSSADNSSVSSASAAQAAANAKVSAVAAMQSAAAALDDAVHTKTDVLFTNPRTPNAQLILLVPDDQLVRSIVRARTMLEPVLAQADALGSKANPVNVDANIAATIAQAQIVITFLNNVVEATTKAIPTTNISAATIASYQSFATAARSESIGAVSSLTAAKNGYDAAVSGATISATSANSGTANDIAAANAQVKSALGVLNAAQANLQKTVIRSPISGTIVSLPLQKGQYVSSMSSVAQVSNPHALEVVAYVTASDAKTLLVGGSATIHDTVKGTIVFVAPALDPSTGKVEVKIGVSGNEKLLTDGDTVSVVLTRTTGAVHGTVSGAATPVMTIPIIAAKITPKGPMVFTVSSSTLSATPVTFGSIIGDTVTITKGLTPDMEIVTDARGLSSGQKVIVDDAP